MSIRSKLPIVGLLAAFCLCPRVGLADQNKQTLVIKAKEAFTDHRYVEAANLCWSYIRTAGESGDKYEAAQFFLAESLSKLGLKQAAVAYYAAVARNRRSPELLPRALTALERYSLSRSLDERYVLGDLIADTDFGVLPSDMSDFVSYWQGVANIRSNLHGWANERFAQISRFGYYFFASLYAASVRLLTAEKDTSAQRFAVESFAERFGALELSAALESLRRRGESDSRLAYVLKAMLNDDNKIEIRQSQLPEGWQIELALLGFARTAAEASVLLERVKETEEEELGQQFSYQVQIGGIPIYRHAPRYEDRAPMIKAISGRREATQRLVALAMHSLARLLYEQQRFGAAYDLLGKIPAGTEPQANILLERAWSKYRSGDAHRAMGLLYALDAPVHRGQFLPEKYILRGLIYRQFCHFRAAKLAAQRFIDEYGRTLAAVRREQELDRIPELRKSSLLRDPAQQLYRLYVALNDERLRLESFKEAWEPSGLLQHLQAVYDATKKRVQGQLKTEVKAEVARIADQMLKSEEQVNLLQYEVGQAVFERVREGVSAKARKPAPKIPPASRRVYYRFTGEYWTDELPHYKFNIEDRCVD